MKWKSEKSHRTARTAPIRLTFMACLSVGFCIPAPTGSISHNLWGRSLSNRLSHAQGDVFPCRLVRDHHHHPNRVRHNSVAAIMKLPVMPSRDETRREHTSELSNWARLQLYVQLLFAFQKQLIIDNWLISLHSHVVISSKHENIWKIREYLACPPLKVYLKEG